MTDKRLLVVDVSPLWELQFTGVSNVVYELTRSLLDGHPAFDISFSVFHRIVETSVILQCVENRSGQLLKDLFTEPESLPVAAEFAKRYPGKTVGLYFHVKPSKRFFDFEAQLYYDFSFLSVPECHHPDTVAYHSKDLSEQVLSNDLIFTISKSTAEDLHFYFDFPPEQTRVALLGFHVDTATAWRAASEFSGKTVEPYFVCVGTIEPRKNVRLLLAWLSQNKWFLQEHRFLFIGREGWGESFEQLIDEAGLHAAVSTGRIVHLGYVTEAQKTALIVGARALIFASLFEGFGLPVLEAMALGVPVAASCTTSVPEVLGPDGIYFDPYSISSFDHAVNTLLSEYRSGESDKRRTRLAQRANEFSYARCYDVIMSGLVEGMGKSASLKADPSPIKKDRSRQQQSRRVSAHGD